MRRTMLAVMAAAALGLAVPGAGIADPGGVPHHLGCPGKGTQGHGPKKAPHNNKGNKCGFHK